MNDFEKIEHLLLHKKHEELNSSELKEVKEYFENATDYNDMRDTLMQVKSTLATDKLLIKPSVELKEKLLQQFENTYTSQNEKNNGKKRPFYRTIAFQWSAAASVIILLSFSAITYFNNLNKSDKEMAVNYKKGNSNSSPSSVDEEETANNTEVSTGSSPDVTIANGEKRDEMTEYEKPVISTNSQDEKGKSNVFGNISVNEDIIKEGDAINTENAPEYYRDNTTIDDSKLNNEEKVKDGIEDKNRTKTYESNTNIPVNEKKKVNPNKNTTLTKNKKEDSINNDKDEMNLGGYMSVNQMVQTVKTDSTNTALDSLKLDSNQMDKRSRDAKIELKKAEKDN